jgi:hypothetical protein
MRIKRNLIQICLLGALACLNPLCSSAAADSLPNFDKRLEQAKANQPAVVNTAKENAARTIRNRVQDVRIDTDEILGSPKFVASTREFLTGANGSGGAVSAATANLFPANEPKRGVKTFLTEHAALFGFGPEALAAAKVNRDYVSASGGFTTTVWQQHVDDIAVFEAVFKAHLTKNGELINVSSQFVPDLQTAAGKIAARATLEAAPPISAPQAIILAAQNVGDILSSNQLTAQDLPQGSEQVQHFRGSPVLNNNSARLAWLPVDAGTLRLCWDVNVESRARGESYKILVDAQSGEIWLRQCLTEYLSPITLSVWTNDSPTPMMPTLSSVSSYQPPQVPRSLVTLAALDANASPDGWINDGDNTTTGNNADAYLDWDNNNQPDPGSHPAGSPNRVFNYVTDLTQQPSNNWAEAVVSLFYWVNFAHDRYYEYGFTEAAGNFQSNNFSRGGVGGDPVLAEAQDSYSLAVSGNSRNNANFNWANFTTSADGEPGRIQMYIFDGPTPNRDGDLDATVIVHEYTHGVSKRLVGGGVDITALQTMGMGEGWSDFCALSLLSNPTNDPDACYAVGAYVTTNFVSSGLTQNYYYGFRRYPYSVNTSINPLTYKDIDTNKISAHTGVPVNPVFPFIATNANEVHFQGEVWCVTLWEARSRMCHKYGTAAGNQRMLQLVIDGMMLSPPNPTFSQARNAILQADLNYGGGADMDLLWASFAKRGMGYYASSPNNNTTTGVGESFVTPADTNAPVLAVLSPANNSVLMSFTNISGTAYDGGSGLQANQIHFTLYNNGNFWSGTYWTNSPPPDPSIDLTASVVNDVWTFASVPTGSAQVQGTYWVNAFARDNAGNLSTPQPGVNSISFTIDRDPPAVTITFPPDGSTITNQPSGNWFQGNASDNPGNHLSLALFIRRNSDNLYWTGSGWGDVSNGFISNTYTSGNQTWQSTGSLPVPGSSLGNGDYHFIAIATDAAGNTQQVDSVVSVDFHPTYVFTAGSYNDINPANHNMRWDNLANWDVGRVPTPDARVVITNYSPDNTILGSLQLYRLDLSGGSLTTSGMLITNLNVSGGVLSGGTIGLPANGVFNWSGGILTGIYNVPAGATVNLTGSADKTLSLAKLTNNGAVNWNGGNVLASYGSVIHNHATFVIQSSGFFSDNNGFYGYGYPLPLFVNNGLLQKTNSNGVTTFAPDNGGWTFNQNGTIDVENGALSSQGQFNVDGGAIFAGPGETRVDAGTVVMNGTNTIQPGATVELAGGSWNGNNVFTGPGTFVWSAGTIVGTNTIGVGANLSISGAGAKTLTGKLASAGNAAWTGAGAINCSFGSVFENDGTFTVQNDSVFYNNNVFYGYGYPLPVFVNNGSWVKTNSPNTTFFHTDNGGVAFNNHGSVTVRSGNLALGGGGTSQNANFNIASGSEVDLTGGTHNFGSGLNFNGGLTRMMSGILNFSGTNVLTNSAVFEIAGGNVTGTNTVAGTGNFNWSGGTISARLGLQSNIVFNITGAGDKTLSLGTINSSGPGTWTGAGRVNASFGSVFENDGTFTVQNDSVFYNNNVFYGYGPPPPVFINNGSWVKTNSPNTTFFHTDNGGVAFNNNGSVTVRSGNLALGGGGTSANDSFTTAAGSVIDFTNGAFYFSGNLALLGGGTERVSGASVTFNNGTNTMGGASTFAIASGVISGTNTVAGTGNFNWSGGTISARLGLQSNIVFNITGAGDKTLSLGTINSSGPGTWTGAGRVNASFGSVFENDGTFTVQNDSVFYNNNVFYGYGPPPPVFINNGSWVKTNSPNTTFFHTDNGGVAFNNNGSVTVRSGNLALGGGGVGNNGSFAGASGSHIDFLAGNFSLTGNLSFSGAGSTRVNGGALTFGNSASTMVAGGTFEVVNGSAGGTNTFAGTGNFNWSGGTISGTISLQPNIALDITGDGLKTLTGKLASAGNGVWTGAGAINFSYGGLFENDGTFTVQNDSVFYNNNGFYGYGPPPPVFVNTGTFRKTGSTNATVFAAANGGVNFNNNGTVDLRSGTLGIDAGYTTSSANQLDISIGGLNAGTQFGNEDFTGAATFAGTLGISLTNGFTPTNGNSFVIATYSSRTGQFSTIQFPTLPAGSQWQLAYNANALVLQVVQGVPSTAFQSSSLTNGNFQFTLVGQTGSMCLIEASTNLFDWTSVLTNAPFNGLLNYVDPQTPQFPKRFYRATIFP